MWRAVQYCTLKMAPVSTFSCATESVLCGKQLLIWLWLLIYGCFRICGPICLRHVAHMGWLPRGFLSFARVFPGVRSQKIEVRFLNKLLKEEFIATPTAAVTPV